jgi:hypothetical protein
VIRPALAVLCMLAAALVAAAPASPAQEARIASYCSPSGDVCYGIFRDAGNVTRFQLTLAARYFGRYRICVKPPSGAATCKSFPVKRFGRLYGGAVKWDRNFPTNRGPGRYRVTWLVGTQRLGPALYFRPSPQA